MKGGFVLQIDKLLKSASHRPDVVFTTMYGEGSDIIYIPENGSISNFFASQKLNTKTNIDSITIPNRITIMGKTIIGNVAYTRMKNDPVFKGYEIYKTIQRLKTKNKSRIIDTSYMIGDIVTLAHTKSITGIYNEFFRFLFSGLTDFDKTEISKKPIKVIKSDKDQEPKIPKVDEQNRRPKILLIDFNQGVTAPIKTGFTNDFDYFLRMNKYQLEETLGTLPDAIVYKINNNYHVIGSKVEVPSNSSTNESKTVSYIKINRMNWEMILKLYSGEDNQKETKKSNLEEDQILGFKSKKNINQILKVGEDLADIQAKFPDQKDHLKMVDNIKKFIEGNPILSDLEGTTFQEKLQNLYYGMSHAEKLQNQRGVQNIKNPEEEEELTKKLETSETDTRTTTKIQSLTDSEKLLVKKYNGTVFLDNMQERTNFGIRSYNPDNIVGLTEFSGYKKQETEFQNNLDDAMGDLIRSMEKDPEIGLKVLSIKSEIKDNNKTRFKRFTAQVQHSNFGQTFKGKYSLILDVPYPTDEKYIKFGGNDYVMVNQLFNKPIQKVNNQLVRLYTHYNTTSVTLKATKFNGVYGLDNMEKEIMVALKNIADNPKATIKVKLVNFDDTTRDLSLDFLPRSTRSKFKYSLVDVNVNSQNFWKIDLSKPKFFEYQNGTNIESAELNKDSKIITYKIGLDVREFPLDHLDGFLMGIYNRISKTVLKRDTIKKSKTSQPYLSAKIIGNQCPVAIMLVSFLGFSKALEKMDVKWTFQEKKIITKEKDSDQTGIGGEPINIQFQNGYITCYPKSFLQRALVQGLNKFKVKTISFIDSPDLYKSVLETSMGAYGYKKFLEAIPKIIDNTTEKILKEYGYPTDILTLYSNTMPSMMLNREESHFENLDYYRIRLSESISHIGYNQIQQALSELKRKKEFKDHKIFLKSEFIMGKLLEAGLFQNAKTINPIEEMMLSQKIVKTGIGNVKKSQVTLARRDLNKSYFGVISATATNEYGGIGSNQTLTNGTMIKDRFGTIQTKEYDNTDNPFKMLAPVESLTPFFEYDDTTRRIMGNQQTGQFTQLEFPDEPLVQTGFESYVPWLVSDRFTKKSRINGKIQLDKNMIKIIGSGPDAGKTQIISLKHARSRTKRGVYLLNKYTPTINDGQNVKPHTIVAATDSLKTGKLAVGKNVVIAEMPYDGMNYEDGWVITGAVQDKYQNKYLQKLTMLIPGNVKVTTMNIAKNQITKPGEVLLEFQKENYHIQNLNLDLDNENSGEDDVLYGLEQHRGTSKYFSPGGKILEIQVRLNTAKPDSKIKSLWDESVKDLKSLQNECSIKAKGEFPGDTKSQNQSEMECLGNIDGIASLSIGGHKISGEEPETGIIEVFIERENPINNGSKFTLGNSGGKGTVQYIIPRGKEPVAVESQLKIDFIPTSLSIIKRKNPSIIFNMYLGKCFFFINEMIKGMLKNKPDDIKSIETFVLSCYGLVDKTNDQRIVKEIESFFKQDKSHIQKAINQSNSLSKPLFAGIVPPFTNHITMRDIVKLSKHVGIPLKEKIHITENGVTTLKKVPVGILNVFLLEHFPQTQGSVRGSMYVKSSIVTGQGSSGSKDRKGATKAGLYDLYSILTKTPYNLIKELHSLKSDAKTAKTTFDRQIFDGNGTPSIADIKISKDDTTTKNYIEALFLGAGLKTFY